MSLAVHIKKRLKDFRLSVDFESEKGCMGLLGASGCGKSMTLKCIAGLETPDEGQILLNGRVFYDSEKKINIPPQGRKVGYLFQNYALFPHMTVRKNLEMGLSRREKKWGKRKSEEQIELLARRFHIEELLDSYPEKMSGGQQQRAALARIVASEPEILFLDEPFSALDSYLREKMLQEMKGFLKEYGGDVVMVSHSRDEIYQMCDRTAVMGKGRIEVLGETGELFRRPQTVGAARLTGCKNISRAVRKDVRTVEAVDWGIRLTSTGEIPGDIAYIGIRAHDLRQVQPGENNVMKICLERLSEAPFEIYLILKNAETDFGKKAQSGRRETGDIWWKLPKNTWDAMGKKVPDRICFPPEHILLLRESP